MKVTVIKKSDSKATAKIVCPWVMDCPPADNEK
jgi:hypothetical protein